jgi:hypothetical protein
MISPLISLAAATILAATVKAGTFNVLTMNVAGLPAIFNINDVPGDKATNAGTIGSKLATYSYDVIHVQEVSSFQYAIRGMILCCLSYCNYHLSFSS